MLPERLLLRFQDRPQAVSVLSAIGIPADAIPKEGTLHENTGETAAFEGEVVALTSAMSGYHINLLWRGEVPHALRPHVLPDAFAARFTNSALEQIEPILPKTGKF